jgi:ATP-dependent RNA helicase DDX41
LYITVHRIGRTGRCGKTGVATTFINKGVDETVLLDLKHLLIEAKQIVPPFLLSMQPDNEKYLDIGGKILSSFENLTCHVILSFTLLKYL